MKKTRQRIIEDMLINREKIKTESNSLKVDCTTEDLNASITCIESNKLEQETSSKGKNTIPTGKKYWESGHYDTNGNKANFSTRTRLIDFVECEPSVEYYIPKHTFIIRGYTKNKEFIQNIGVVNAGNIGKTFSTGEDVYFLGVAVDKNYDEYDEESDQFMICKASEVDKTWEKGYVDMPSVKHKSEVLGVSGDIKLVVHNKNLIFWGTLMNGFTDLQTGRIKMHPSATAYYFETLKLPKNITISAKNANRSNISYFNEIPNKVDVQSEKWTNINSTEIPKSIEVDKQYKYILVQFTYNQVATDIQVEAENKATEFAESKKQNFIISLGERTLYKGDKIVRQNGKWYFSNVWSKVDDFSNLVSESVGIAGKKRGWKPLNLKYKLTDRNNHKNGGFCNIAKLALDGQTYNGDIGFTVGIIGNGKRLFIYTEELSEIQTSQELQEKMSELEAYFILPIEEELELIEDEVLIKQLDKILLNIYEYDDETNFDFDNNVTFEIEVEKDKLRILENRLDKAEENTTSATMLALESEE